MLSDDDRHGTYAGHVQHSLTATPMCEPCRTAGTRYMKQRRMRLENGEQLTTPRLGAQRRIHALMALGWTGTDIALACGWADRASVLQILRPPKRGWGDRGIFRKTDNTIRAAYDALSMTLPEMTAARSRVRNMARRNGWMPPLMWDDNQLDDPNATPHRTETDKQTKRLQSRGQQSADATIENAEWMADADETLTSVCDRLGIKPETFYQTCRRAGRTDLYARLSARDPNGDLATDMRALKRGAA